MENLTQIIVGDRTLLRYRDLNYKIWHAISEFVDNSLHAFLHLDGDYKPDRCEVSIDFDSETFTIFDNAGGIAESDFENVLSVGTPKVKSSKGTQLSEFGMGLKTAGIWMADKITIETKHYKSEKAFLIVIDIEKLRDENIVNYVTINPCKPSSNFKGYTRVVLSSLNRTIAGKNIEKIYKPALSSIYNRYIKDGVLLLRWDDPLPSGNLVLGTNFKDGGDELKWPIDTYIESHNGEKKRIKGWIGILAKHTASLGGFYIYRNGRQIHGFPNNQYRPTEFFAENQNTSSFVLQRMVGEFDLDDWSVNHTKDGMNWGFDEHEFIDVIKEIWEIAKAKMNSIRHSEDKEKPLDDYLHDVNLRTAAINVEQLIHRTQTDNNASILNGFEVDPLHTFSYETLMVNLNSQIWREENTKLLLSFFNNRLNKQIAVYYLNCSDENIPHSTTKIDLISGKDTLSVFINKNHKYIGYILQNTTMENRESLWMTFLWNTIVDAMTDEMMTSDNKIVTSKQQKEILHGKNFAWYVENINEIN
jgi:hypothetical protein